MTDTLAAPPCDAAAFKRFAGSWATGVAVVTTVDRAGAPFGLTMSAVTSLSIDPLQLLICVDNRSNTLAPMRESGLFCVHLLAAGQRDLSRRFAGKDPDKFAGVAWRRLPSGVPLLEGVLAWMECRIAATHPGGDHTILVGDALATDLPGGEPLLHYRGGYRDLAPC